MEQVAVPTYVGIDKRSLAFGVSSLGRLKTCRYPDRVGLAVEQVAVPTYVGIDKRSLAFGVILARKTGQAKDLSLPRLG